MKLDRRRQSPALCAAWIGCVLLFGCAPWRRSDETLLRVEAPRNLAQAERLTQIGIRALQKGHLEKAADAFVSAIRSDSTFGPAHNNLGLIHFQRGELYLAMLAFEQAMEYLPQDPSATYNLALALESAGKTFEALDLYIQAVEMEPTNPVFLGNLVRLRIRLGEDDPLLLSQLQDLALLETRAPWRRWADQQLALFHNPTLDRGPTTPEFDPQRGEATQDVGDVRDRTIDLTPLPPESLQPPQPMPERGPSDLPILNSANGSNEELPLPNPIRIPRSIESLH